MKLHLVDGTYELFRAHYGAPAARSREGQAVGATRGLSRSLLSLLRQRDVTHIACAFDTVIESFRNELYPDYKTGEGVEPELLAQFELAERLTYALGIVVWSMIELEADDALATAAARWKDGPGVEQVVICSPDKDLAQCVEGKRVIVWDRRRKLFRDEQQVLAKYGVPPSSIPDWLALVGDSADGFPGLPGWGRKVSALMLYRYRHLEAIPKDPLQWDIEVARADRLARSLREGWEKVELFRRLATLRKDAPIKESLEDLEWKGARRSELEALAAELGDEELPRLVPRWRVHRGGAGLEPTGGSG